MPIRILFETRCLLVGLLILSISCTAGCQGGSSPVPPEIISLNVPASVINGSTADVSCTATDANGDAIQYRWRCERGSIQGSGSVVTYSAPQVSYEMLDFINVSINDIRSSNPYSSPAYVANLGNQPVCGTVLNSLLGISPICGYRLPVALISGLPFSEPAPVQFNGMGSGTSIEEYKYLRIIPDADLDIWEGTEEGSVFMMPSEGIVYSGVKLELYVYTWFGSTSPFARIQEIKVPSDVVLPAFYGSGRYNCLITGVRLGDLFSGHEDEWSLEQNGSPDSVNIIRNSEESVLATNRGVLLVYEVDAQVDPASASHNLMTYYFRINQLQNEAYFPRYYVNDPEGMGSSNLAEFQTVGKDYGQGFTDDVEISVMTIAPEHMGGGSSLN